MRATIPPGRGARTRRPWPRSRPAPARPRAGAGSPVRLGPAPMTADTAPADTTRLARRITPWLLFLFILGDVLGAGVYALTGELAQEAGGLMWAPLVLALLMALLTAASYAELVTKYPRAGGAAVFAQRAFGRPLVSFLVGFAMLAAGVTSAAGLSLAFTGDYLATFVDVPTVVAAPLFLVLLALLNARGIKESVRSNVGMTIIEVSGLVLVIVVVAVAVAGPERPGAGRGRGGRCARGRAGASAAGRRARGCRAPRARPAARPARPRARPGGPAAGPRRRTPPRPPPLCRRCTPLWGTRRR